MAHIPNGADAYWQAGTDTTDTRDDPPDWLADLDLPDETVDALAASCDEITPETASVWAREAGEGEAGSEGLPEIYGVPV